MQEKEQTKLTTCLWMYTFTINMYSYSTNLTKFNINLHAHNSAHQWGNLVLIKNQNLNEKTKTSLRELKIITDAAQW